MRVYLLFFHRAELKEAVADTAALTHQMNDCHAKISGNRRQGKKLGRFVWDIIFIRGQLKCNAINLYEKQSSLTIELLLIT